ncbi:MAG: flavin reductase family protein [Solirubrobacterales bacterium]|nr:flavin reductase family protein [Solirubrobacterales bacterium]
MPEETGQAKRDVPVEDLFGFEYWPPIPAFLVSTTSAAGKYHVSPFSLVTFTSYTGVAEDPETPKIISLVIGDYDRFDEVQRSATYRNIQETGEYVVNVPTLDLATQLNRTGAPSEDKFAKASLHAGASRSVAAPCVEECPVNFECRLESIVNQRWNGEIIHGRVVGVQVSSELAATPAEDRPERFPPLYHYTYDQVNGTYYGLGEAVLDEAKGE